MIELISTPYMIRMPWGIIATQQLVMATLLNLASRLFKTNLIILEIQGIDMILGMGWMKGLKAVLGIVSRTMHLESPTHVNVVLQLPSSTSHPQHFILQSLKTWKTFLLPVSFLMSF
jgi:hypothetical protein